MTTNTLLIDSLHIDRIQVHSDIASSKRLLEVMATLLTTGLDETTKEKDVFHLLLEREKLGNTGVGEGVAIPHSRCQFTDTAVLAMITLEKAIDYDSIDGQPVDLAFGLLVPENASQEHLNLLASIAKLMSNQQYKQTLTSAKTPESALKLMERWSKL